MPKVIVVPETSEYQIHVSHKNVVWINKNLGVPRLDENDARYVAPFWLDDSPGVTRIYHILSVKDVVDSTEIGLGNSFVLLERWTGMGEHRRFEYHELANFGFVEVCPGILIPNK